MKMSTEEKELLFGCIWALAFMLVIFLFILATLSFSPRGING